MVERYRFNVFCLVLFFLLARTGIADSAPGAVTAGLEQVPCWFDALGTSTIVVCYRVSVPEDYEQVDSEWIEFPVVRIVADTPVRDSTPVLHLGGGGPGNPVGLDSADNIGWLLDLYGEFSVQDGRDLFIMDPRGTGEAAPLLNCPEYVDAVEPVLGTNAGGKEENRIALQAYRQCRQRMLSEGIDLDQYHSKRVADDVAALGRAAGVDRWHLYGVSYGSRYAQTIARETPGLVESMILDAATFMDVRYTERLGGDYQAVIDRLLYHCSSSVVCRFTLGGDVNGRFWRLVRQLEDAPPVFVLPHPYEAGNIEVALTGKRFLGAYYSALYLAQAYAELPLIIKSLERDELGKFQAILEDWLYYLLDRSYGDGAAISHYCYEESPFSDFDAARSGLDELHPVLGEIVSDSLEYSESICEIWGIGSASAVEGEPLVTDVPSLFLHGALDPVLPAEDLANQSRNFSMGAFQVFPEISHTVMGFDNCATEMVRAFMSHKLDYLDYVQCRH